ncbi:response regulator [Streptomyces axinellae]|uniref:Response regulator n=1 Tax=Streptomyces axinellae TaxID=552788 RepID=A0ABN3PXA0_9ACTN
MSGRVLVVDDSKVIRQLIRVNLELEGFEVVTAVDGAECLDVVHRARPDVVTLDAMMPRLDGLRTAERLRADPRTRHLPLALVSACTELDGGGAVGSPHGVDAFLAKPFEPAELVRMVQRLVRGGREDGGERAGASGPRGAGVSLGAGDTPELRGSTDIPDPADSARTGGCLGAGDARDAVSEVVEP